MQVWTILFQRLQQAKTARYVRGLLVFLSHFIVKRGPQALAASTDPVQPGILAGLLGQVWKAPLGSGGSRLCNQSEGSRYFQI